MQKSSAPIGVMLMSFGTPATADDVPSYLTRVRGGRPFPPEFVEEFKRRFRMIGGSPLLKMTLAQASALEMLLNREAKNGRRYRVVVGMRHAPPYMDEALAKLAAEGVRDVIGIIMAPQQTRPVMAGYYTAAESANAALGNKLDLRIAGAWHTTPAFVDSLIRRIREGIKKFPLQERDEVAVIMTAHSLPKVVVRQSPEYEKMLLETARQVASRLRLAPSKWVFSYQSAGQQSSEEWLQPDIKEILRGLTDQGHRCVLVAPIQFLSDHLEILYDIDIAAKAEADALGLKMLRTDGLNTVPELIRALADVVHREEAADR